MSHLNGPAAPDGAIGWEAAVAKIDEFRALADDYDGQGARAPAPETIDAAAELVHGLTRAGVPSPTWVTPGVNGSVDLSWEFGGGVSVAVDVTEPDEADVFLLVPGRQPGHWVVTQTAAV
ncbi:MAG: hypothetical protein C0501_28580 [Isosphaera sp.]|nr:hypothetical protein [Isosphaera sp.]